MAEINNNIVCFINGFVPVAEPVCPELDIKASVQISSKLISIYQSRIDALINQLGKSVLLEYTPIETPCPNCLYDTMRKRSTGIYRTGGPRPFKRGRQCPYCKSRGLLETPVEKCIRCLISWNPNDSENYDISVSHQKDIVRFKTYTTNFDNLVGAKSAIANYDIRDKIRLRVKRITAPILVGLRESRYCISFWELL